MEHVAPSAAAIVVERNRFRKRNAPGGSSGAVLDDTPYAPNDQLLPHAPVVVPAPPDQSTAG